MRNVLDAMNSSGAGRTVGKIRGGKNGRKKLGAVIVIVRQVRTSIKVRALACWDSIRTCLMMACLTVSEVESEAIVAVFRFAYEDVRL